MISFLHITRMDYRKPDGQRNARGWFVRVPGCPSKLFSDSVYGGRLRARDAALDWRDALCAEKKIKTTGRRVAKRARHGNQTGIVGVHLDGARRAIASWVDADGIAQRKWFPYKTWGGIGGAVEAAAKCRMEMTLSA